MTLNDFYSTAYQRGFSRDYQIRVSEIIINGEKITDSLEGQILNYVKTASIPSRKVETTSVSYHTVKIPVSTGIADFGNKENYQITFWADQGLDFRAWFYDRSEYYSNIPNTSKFPPELTNNKIQIEVLDDMLETVLQYTLQGVTIKEVSEIKYNKEGSGKPQEFTVTFAFYNVVPTTGFSSGATQTTRAANTQGGVLGLLQDISKYAKATTTAVQAVRGVATAARSTSRAIRGR